MRVNPLGDQDIKARGGGGIPNNRDGGTRKVSGLKTRFWYLLSLLSLERSTAAAFAVSFKVLSHKKNTMIMCYFRI